MARARGGGSRRSSDKPGILERLDKGVVLGDGGYLLELEKRGYVQAGPFTPEVVVEYPEAVRELHREFIHAGSEVVQALAFYASKEKLATTGHGGQVEAINRAAVRLAREAASGTDTLVAANISLTWMYDPKERASPNRVRRLFDQQLDAQVSEGADFVIAETFSYLGEALLATERSVRTGLPVMVTMSFDQKPVSYDGSTPSECARALRDAGANVVGVNCLRNPEHILPIAAEMRRAVRGFIACQPAAYRTTEGHLDFTSLPEFPYNMEGLQMPRRDFGEFAVEAKALGIEYVGACCGAVASHIRDMSRALGKAPPPKAWRVDYERPMSAYEYYGHERPAARRTKAAR